MTERRADLDPLVWAPWTDEQVRSLNDFQRSGVMHPFTGRNDLLPFGKDDVLEATMDGWVSKVDPEYRQTWAHAFMADRSWEVAFGWMHR